MDLGIPPLGLSVVYRGVIMFNHLLKPLNVKNMFVKPSEVQTRSSSTDPV